MRNFSRLFAYLLSIPLLGSGIFLFSPVVVWAAESLPEVKIVDEQGETLKKLDTLHDLFSRGASMAVGDLGGDGIEEIIVAEGEGNSPRIQIFRQDGSRIGVFYAYAESFRGGINVAVGDVNGDGIDEIVTAPADGGTPQIRVFDGRGNVLFTPGFLAYAESFRGGMNVAVGDVNGDGTDEIITAPAKEGGPQVKIFDRYGDWTGFVWPFEAKFTGGVSIAAANVDGVAGDEIIAGRQSAGDSEVRVYANGKNLLSHFDAFGERFQGGVNVTGADLDGNGTDEIVTTPASGGGPQVRIFNLAGSLIASTFVYANDFRGGVRVSAIDFAETGGGEEVVVAPSQSDKPATGGKKRIDVDISEQVMRMFEGDTKVGEHQISTGTWSMPTPLGTFRVQNHIRTAYSKRYALYMDWWMAITPDGVYGLHSLPYWKTKNGIVYEGRDHIGKRVSHGCIRQLPEKSKMLYNWAPNGTEVVIHN